MPQPEQDQPIDEEQAATTWLSVHRARRESTMLDALNRIRLYYANGVGFTVKIEGITAEPGIKFDIPDGPKTNPRQYTRDDQ